MGLLTWISAKEAPCLAQLPCGSFSVDRRGQVIASTISQGFPQARIEEIGQLVLTAFRSAQETNVPLQELIVEFTAFRLTARELRGGAMVFLTPLGFASKTSPR